jgi:hypothetical protein
MKTEWLVDTKLALGKDAEALSKRFHLNGYVFVWQEKMEYNYKTGTDGKFTMEPMSSLRIFSADHNDLDVSYEIDTDGSIKHYSFFSTSGNNAEDALKSRNYLQTCVDLLSDNFRQTILFDYREKLETLNNLKNRYEIINGELERRYNEDRTRTIEAKAERKKQFENVGQVWFDYNWHSGGVRYVVNETTEKTILFNIFSYNKKEEKWNAFDTKRINKQRLGVAICPVGTDDLNSQKAERPETVDY